MSSDAPETVTISKEDAVVIHGILSMVAVGHPFDEDIRAEAQERAKDLLAKTIPPAPKPCENPLCDNRGMIHDGACLLY